MYSSSSVVKKNGRATSCQTANAFQVAPHCMVHAWLTAPSVVLNASQPWSNNNPKGLELPVRRACLPSRLSSVCVYPTPPHPTVRD